MSGRLLGARLMGTDAIVVGGGLGGAAIAEQLARCGRSVLVLERDKQFKDRVRGENMLPWGVATARRLGILDDLVTAGAHRPCWWNEYAMGQPAPPRDLRTTTPEGDVCVNMYHPAMQEALLQRAINAGATVLRGARVTDVAPGNSPTVTFEYDSKVRGESARVVIGADGRASRVRSWGRFKVESNPDLLTIAGTLLDGVDAPDDAVHLAFGPGFATLLAPLGSRRARAYFVYPGVARRRGLSGAAKAPEFIDACRSALLPEPWLANARSIGPLAEFEGADRWVPSPAKNGIVLVGDAAASSDPSWGCGLSLTLTDVEHLSSALCESDDWNAALDRYAAEHDEYYSALHRILSWYTELAWTPGPEADARREKVMPKLMSDPTGFPDPLGTGPFGPSDERARRLVLGLD